MSETKISQLEKIEGKDRLTMAEEATFDSVAPGICTNVDCRYSTTVEPDQQHGYCDECGTQTVASILVLMDLI